MVILFIFLYSFLWFFLFFFFLLQFVQVKAKQINKRKFKKIFRIPCIEKLI